MQLSSRSAHTGLHSCGKPGFGPLRAGVILHMLLATGRGVFGGPSTPTRSTPTLTLLSTLQLITFSLETGSVHFDGTVWLCANAPITATRLHSFMEPDIDQLAGA